MIIVEGPDGSGKDTLIAQLMSDFGTLVVRGPRAVKSSHAGPVDNLGKWVAEDLRQWPWSEATRIYNRHPLISEPIYGPLLRGHVDPGFQMSWDLAWNYFTSNTLVIFCLPPLSVVMNNVSQARDMPGVAENIEKIWESYRAGAKEYPGWAMKYDYTEEGPIPYRKVQMAAMVHINEREKNRADD